MAMDYLQPAYGEARCRSDHRKHGTLLCRAHLAQHVCICSSKIGMISVNVASDSAARSQRVAWLHNTKFARFLKRLRRARRAPALPPVGSSTSVFAGPRGEC